MFNARACAAIDCSTFSPIVPTPCQSLGKRAICSTRSSMFTDVKLARTICVRHRNRGDLLPASNHNGPLAAAGATHPYATPDRHRALLGCGVSSCIRKSKPQPISRPCAPQKALTVAAREETAAGQRYAGAVAAWTTRKLAHLPKGAGSSRLMMPTTARLSDGARRSMGHRTLRTEGRLASPNVVFGTTQ